MAIVIGILVLMLALMALGWRARLRRQSGLAKPATTPEELGEQFGRFEGKYVATTVSGDPLDRVAVHGLGFRGNATVQIAENGVLLRIAGGRETWIPTADLRARRTATWAIDRVVEPGGLQLLEWQLGDTSVDSYFRFDDALEFARIVDRVIERNAA